MRFISLLSAIVALITYSCQSGAINNIEQANETIQEEGVTNDTYQPIIDLLSLSQDQKKDWEALDKLSIEQLIQYEQDLLSELVPLPDYYRDSVVLYEVPDTGKYTFRCAAIDNAPVEALRAPQPAAEKQAFFFTFAVSSISIPVHVHIINNDSGYMMYDQKQGKALHVSMEMIERQLNLVNSVFNQENISFQLASVDSVNNTDWNELGMDYYEPAIAEAMYDSLGQSPETHMNLYIIFEPQSGNYWDMLGEATFPWKRISGKFQDHVTINCITLPGFLPHSVEKNGQGKTLIHEIGHYLGLYHTFEGNSGYCSDSNDNDGCYYGDRVPDTPAQRICHYGDCEANGQILVYNTCSQDPGDDPLNNYMGYNDDKCLTHFTPGQINRAFVMVSAHRPKMYKQGSSPLRF